MVSVAYHGPYLDYSGYGEANRQFINALVAAGVDVESQLVRFTPKKDIDLGVAADVAAGCSQPRNDYKIKIIHTTADVMYRYVEGGKYNISHLFWETDKLPRSFVEGLELVDEIWTGSEANKQAILNSGVEKPIFVFPQPFITDNSNIGFVDIISNKVDDLYYKFYSIFEWTDRKNPELLIKSFLSEFDGVKDVCLVLKVYFQDNDNKTNDQEILASIRKFVSDLNLISPPLIVVVMTITNKQTVMSLHNSCDCYVSPHRGEGWGIPIVEAMSVGNPVIVSSYGGIGEYLNDNKNGYPLPYNLVPLNGMNHARHYYELGQNWAEIDESIFRQKMRFVYENQAEAKRVGNTAKSFVKSRLSPLVVGKLMRKRLEEIERNLT